MQKFRGADIMHEYEGGKVFSTFDQFERGSKWKVYVKTEDRGVLCVDYCGDNFVRAINTAEQWANGGRKG